MANQHHRSLSSTTRLDRHIQLTTGHPWHHEYPRLLVLIARGPRKSPVEADQLSQAMSDTDSALM